MSRDGGPPDKALVPAADQRALSKRSADLVERGLQLARGLRPDAVAITTGPRVIRFPEDRSMGTLWVYDNYDADDDSYEPDEQPDFDDIDARGAVLVSEGKYVVLWVSAESAVDISPLAKLRDDDLQQLNFDVEAVITDAALVHVEALTGLKYLDLAIKDITDAGLVHVEALASLTELDLSNTQITDSGLVHLEGLSRLRYLNLSATDLTDAGLAHLGSLSDLTHVNLSGTGITAVGLAKLRAKLPGCQIT